jgi:lysophospholipase L1-like esterase
LNRLNSSVSGHRLWKKLWPRAGRIPTIEARAEDRYRRAQRKEEFTLNRVALRTVLASMAVAGMLSAAALAAQAPAAAAETKAAPAPSTTTAPTAKKANNDDAKQDWASLGRFKEADLALAAPAADENRVVFMGDSITQGWHIDGSFPGKPYINRGISGQTTPQMLVRFRQDVIALKPKVVVILAGTNDIAGNTGPMTIEETEGNLASMAELATANHIRVVLCSVTPAFDYPWRPGLTPAPKILAINAWMKALAAEKGYIYVDFHSAMKDERDGLPPTLSYDGVHPLPAGYAVMAPLAEAGIEKALGQ